jgi:mannan polymerase complexes MNN9 subunit
MRHERAMADADSDLLWLILTYDETSWGLAPGLLANRKRSIEDFLEMLAATNLNLQNMSLGLMTSSEEEYNHFIQATKDIPVARVTIFMHPGFSTDAALDREHRHDSESQTARRTELAQLRNYLMLSALRDEQHVVWLDADVYYLDENIVQRMISHSESREDAGIITARCEAPWGPNYDLNAWAGPYKHAQIVADLVKDTSDDDLIPLTSVGATLLYIRASLVRKGVNFPPYYVVNTSWDGYGDDGIESEGMCYQARGLKGGGCFLLGGSWHTKHGD